MDSERAGPAGKNCERLGGAVDSGRFAGQGLGGKLAVGSSASKLTSASGSGGQPAGSTRTVDRLSPLQSLGSRRYAIDAC
jgi:hypothetical protein